MDKGMKDWLAILTSTIVLAIIMGIAFGPGTVRLIFLNPKLVALLIVGFIGILFGIRQKHWGALFILTIIVLTLFGC